MTGWSKAEPARTPHDPDVALFGGFRVQHLTAEQMEEARAGREEAARRRRLLRGG